MIFFSPVNITMLYLRKKQFLFSSNLNTYYEYYLPTIIDQM